MSRVEKVSVPVYHIEMTEDEIIGLRNLLNGAVANNSLVAIDLSELAGQLQALVSLKWGQAPNWYSVASLTDQPDPRIQRGKT